MKSCSASSSQVLRMSAFTPNSSRKTTTAEAGEAFGRAIYAPNAPSRPSMVMRSFIEFSLGDDANLGLRQSRQDRRRPIIEPAGFSRRACTGLVKPSIKLQPTDGQARRGQPLQLAWLFL